jgi:hypothetical protein
MKTQNKSAVKQARFRPGSTGACEAQLWIFSGQPDVLNQGNVPDVHWVAAESLDAAPKQLYSSMKPPRQQV